MERLRFLYHRLTKLNVFNKETDDEHVRRSQIISTRIYIILLTTVLCLFTLYTWLPDESTVINIPTPSQLQYEQLELQFSNSLQCPCTHIAISYEDFIVINPSYHPICSSDFVSQRWIDYLFYENASYYYQLDFRRSASMHFQILRTLCQEAQQTVNDNLVQFYSKQLTTIQVIPGYKFNVQTDSFIELFQVITPTLFENTLKLIREIFIANQLYSAIDVLHDIRFSKLVRPYVYMADILYYETQVKGKNFGCYCNTNLECKLPASIYANLNRYEYAGSDWMIYGVNASTNMINGTVKVPGMFAGCSSVESVMQSTGECLFNQSCLSLISQYFNYTIIPINSFTKLNTSRFTPQMNYETIANELFIEDWNSNRSYEKYFNQCQPAFCQYMIEQKGSFAHILTTIISLYGGLRLFLKCLVPIVVKFIRKKRRQQTISPDNVPPSGKYCSILCS